LKVAVLGASGLVGHVLTQRLRGAGADVRPCVRNPSTSWPLIRLGIDLATADLRDEAGLASALQGCSHVVNCALGEDRDLVRCMHNLVRACKRQGVRHLVHLSSVTVYGDPPRPDCEFETGRPLPRRNTYGWHKLKQDEIALRAARDGLSTAVLCLPHVTGPDSRFVLSIIRELSEQRFAFVDGGVHPLVLADVNNVCRAIELAIHAPGVDGERMFINDGGRLDWRQFIERVAPLAGVRVEEIPDIPERSLGASSKRRLSLRAAATQIIALPEVKAILRRTSLAGDGALAKRAKWLLKRGPLSASRPTTRRESSHEPAQPPVAGLWRQQVRKVPHSIARAEAMIGYRPEVSFEGSMDAFERWYSDTHQYGTEYWELARRV
jgi:nucleoside-diphosphate-sugar epimerase